MFKFNFKRIFIGVVFVLGLLWVNAPSAFANAGFETTRYDVQAQVYQEGYVDMEETIDVNFVEARHGIYFYVNLAPQGYLTVDGKQYDIAQNLSISDVEVESDQPGDVEVQQDGQNYILKIGDPEQYVVGPATYTIHYRMDFARDKIEDFDYLYLNLYPTGWETSVDQFTASVTFPKGYDQESVELYVNDNFQEEHLFEEGQLTLNSSGYIPKSSYAVLEVIYPQDFFQNTFDPNWIYSTLTVVALVMLLLGLLIKVLFGRRKKIFRTVEFHPPNGFSPAELGYVVDRIIDKKDIISLVIYFANQGLLDVEGQDKRDMVLIKKKEMSPDAPRYEQIFFYGLFACGDGNRVKISEVGEDFAQVYKQTEASLANRFNQPGRKLKSKRNIFFRGLGRTLALLPFGFYLLGIILMFYGAWKFLVVPAILIFLIADRKSAFFKKRETYSKGKYLFLSLGSSLAVAVLMMATLLVAQKYLLFYPIDVPVILWMVAFVAISVGNLALVNTIDRPSDYLTESLGKILGFRDFIEKAEADRLEALVEEDPQYFFNILPYAYSLGISDKWIKNFETLPVTEPLWGRSFYAGYAFNVGLFMGHFSVLETSMMENIASKVPDNVGAIAGAAVGGAMGGRGGGSW